jgi:4-amino-4-deoxy-L-arabinose transferase-like glycosyltransferase
MPERWYRPALLAVGIITALRVLALALGRAELFVDEAQYWLWAQELAFGYYSKPPMIAWVIRAATEAGGSDAAFWIRLPAPLFHGATALVLMRIARGLWGGGIAALTGLAYLTLPVVAVGSAVISTDTMLFPFFALALMFWLRLLGRPTAGAALAAGVCLGLAFLAKYSAVYFVIGAGLAALSPAGRPPLRLAALAALACALTAAPNLVWNLTHGLPTVQHTLDNADWVRDPAARAGLNLRGWAEFVLAQFAVFGPVLFGALLWSGWRVLSGRAEGAEARLLAFSLPAVALVSVQGLLSRAYANWAAPAYLAGVLVAVPLLARRAPRWLALSFVVNGAVSVALPVATALAPTLSLGGDKLLLGRFIGREEASLRILDAAQAAGAGAIVATHRDLLADLFHTGRDAGIPIFAPAPRGRPANHYEMAFPYVAPGAGPVLLAGFGEAPSCDATPAGEWTPTQGAYARRRLSLWLVAADCPDLG